MRPNIHITNTDRLPIRQLSNGNWQLRKRISGGKRVEVALGTTDKVVAEERARKLMGAHGGDVLHSTWAQTVKDGSGAKGWLWRMQYNMAARSRSKGYAETISLEVLSTIALRSAGRCEVSGIPFYMGPLSRHPFQASIDRVDSSLGYELTNVRFVCLSVNMCMAQWGDAVFRTIAAATAAKSLAELASNCDFGGNGGEKISRPNTGAIL